MSNASQLTSLLVAVGIPLGLGGLTGMAIAGDIKSEWYAAIKKRVWTPPSWVFAPVWTTLYVLMGVASWLVWTRVGWSWPLVPYAVQLALNVAWSWLFFRARSVQAALVDIVALLGALVVTTSAFATVSTAAAVLLVPYLAWTTFAATLTASIAGVAP